MDLVFCCIRVLLVLIGIAGAMAIESGAVKIPMPTEFLWWEVYAGLGIVVLGVPANILLLMNKRAGVLLGYLTVVAVAASLSFWRCPT